MNPKNIQLIQNELAMVWDDGEETYISLEHLRRCCPCAACGGERDVMGREYKAPSISYGPKSFELIRFQTVGGYAINLVWGDGHSSGIYPYPLLKKLGGMEEEN